MKNLYSPSKLLSKQEFSKIIRALEKSWSAQTATFADTTQKWSSSNPPRGQCLVTAVLINDMFGGKLIYARENHHFWNELPDKTRQDLTRNQYKTPQEFVITKYKTKDEVLNDEYALKNKTKDRYNLLRQRFRENYAKLA